MKSHIYCSYVMLITETALLYSKSCRFLLLKQRVSRLLGLKDFSTYVKYLFFLTESAFLSRPLLLFFFLIVCTANKHWPYQESLLIFGTFLS
jgi:hypothetical protein